MPRTQQDPRFLPPASRKVTPSIADAGSSGISAAATSSFVSPVTRAPASMSADGSSSIAASRSSSERTDQSSGSLRTETISGAVRVRSILASSPLAHWHSPISNGRSDDGVPENPIRTPKSISPPRSWPLADSLLGWCAVVSGRTTASR